MKKKVIAETYNVPLLYPILLVELSLLTLIDSALVGGKVFWRGGLVDAAVGIDDGKIEIDDTFEGRLKRGFDSLRVKAARILFGVSK